MNHELTDFLAACLKATVAAESCVVAKNKLCNHQRSQLAAFSENPRALLLALYLLPPHKGDRLLIRHVLACAPADFLLAKALLSRYLSRHPVLADAAVTYALEQPKELPTLSILIEVICELAEGAEKQLLGPFFAHSDPEVVATAIDVTADSMPGPFHDTYRALSQDSRRVMDPSTKTSIRLSELAAEALRLAPQPID